MRRALNVAYTLLLDGDLGDDRFDLWDRQLLGLPYDAVDIPADPPSEPPSKWDRDSWGTTAEAQEQLVRALEIIGA